MTSRVPPVPGAGSCDEVFFPGRALQMAAPSTQLRAAPRHKGTENAINERKGASGNGCWDVSRSRPSHPRLLRLRWVSARSAEGLRARVVRTVWSFPKELMVFLGTGRSPTPRPCLLTQLLSLPASVLGLQVPLKGQSSAPAALPCRDVVATTRVRMWVLQPLQVQVASPLGLGTDTIISEPEATRIQSPLNLCKVLQNISWSV